MDKHALNDQIVLMRPGVRAAKRNLCKSLLGKMKQLKNKIAKVEEAGTDDVKKRLTNKMEHVRKEIESIDSVPDDEVSKFALERDENLKLLISDPKTSAEDRVLAKIGSLQSVQKSIEKFKQNHPDSEAWLKPLLELWAEKKRMREGKSSARPKQVHGSNAIQLTNVKNIEDRKQAMLKFTVTPTKSKQIDVPEDQGVKKTSFVKLDKKMKPNHKVVKSLQPEIKESEAKTKKPKRDSFFVNSGAQDDEEIDLPQKKPPYGNEANYGSSRDAYPKKFENNRKPKFTDDSRHKQHAASKHSFQAPAKAQEEKLHPSWTAKKQQRSIDLTAKPKTHIKF
ncbi:hypothetical protein HDE_02915 [Halotydeus destructor]|nr:hypothetical protein HDE_02915 [Halotydeus destructor]